MEFLLFPHSFHLSRCIRFPIVLEALEEDMRTKLCKRSVNCSGQVNICMAFVANESQDSVARAQDLTFEEEILYLG